MEKFFERLEAYTPERVQGLYYIYIFIALFFIVILKDPYIQAPLLAIQLFMVVWNIKRNGVLYNNWKKLWRDLKDGSL